MFWTDWGQTAKIERAFMDGEDRRVLHEVGLSQPNGITIDYAEQKIYSDWNLWNNMEQVVVSSDL